jgi:hypothetical protein
MAIANGAPAKKAAPAGWTVPTLPEGFLLDDAMQRATVQVTGHYRTVLAPQGLQVDLEPAAAADANAQPAVTMEHSAINVAQGRHTEGPLQASLREQGTGRLVKAYTAPALLTLFATQQQATGVVVDGQV